MSKLKPLMSPPERRIQIKSWLLSTWSELLGVAEVDGSDDFFELGGTSAQVMELIVSLSQDLQITVPTSIIIDNSTLDDLAGAILRRDPAVTGRAPRDDGVRVFCVHGNFTEVARSLCEDIALYRLPPHGFYGSVPPPTVAGMARDYLERVVAIQPRGPYVLAGYSFGGAIAHEMACQLKRQGESVSSLILIDSTDPAVGVPDPDKLARLAAWEERIARGDPPVDPDERHALFLAGLHRAGHGYRPGDYTGDATYLLAAASGDEWKQRKVQTWRSRCGGSLVVREIPGDHASMMTGDNARVLAEAMADAIRQGMPVDAAAAQ